MTHCLGIIIVCVGVFSLHGAMIMIIVGVYDGRAVASQDLSDQEGGSRPHGSVDGDEGRRPSIPPQVFPDNQQVFVGNLPQYLSDKELLEFFGRTFLFVLAKS